MISPAQDIRFALRQLRKSPGYALVAIITLALGIGANTAIFLLTYSVLLKSLPVPHPSQLILYTFRKGDSELGLSYPPIPGAGATTGSRHRAYLRGVDGEAVLEHNGQSQKIPIA